MYSKNVENSVKPWHERIMFQIANIHPFIALRFPIEGDSVGFDVCKNGMNNPGFVVDGLFLMKDRPLLN